jgi:hypothetical protein
MGIIANHAEKKTHVYAEGAMCSSAAATGTKMKSQLTLIGIFSAARTAGNRHSFSHHESRVVLNRK